MIKSNLQRILNSDTLQALIRNLVGNHNSRQIVNVIYNTLTPKVRLIFSQYFASVFDNVDYPSIEPRANVWNISFAGKRILLPLRSELFSLDWHLAVDSVSREPKVVQTFENLITCHPPNYFIDIGANYGLYSLMFLSCGINTISFEPNPNCYEYFRLACSLNNVSPHIETVALSSNSGNLELWFPKNSTLLGTLDEDILVQWESMGYEMSSEPVRVSTLDSYFSVFKSGNLLIKIDVEGYEYYVLEGSNQVITKLLPRIVFECYSLEKRAAIFEFLITRGYHIYCLPFHPEKQEKALDLKTFMLSPDPDFIAVPVLKYNK